MERYSIGTRIFTNRNSNSHCVGGDGAVITSNYSDMNDGTPRYRTRTPDERNSVVRHYDIDHERTLRAMEEGVGIEDGNGVIYNEFGKYRIGAKLVIGSTNHNYHNYKYGDVVEVIRSPRDESNNQYKVIGNTYRFEQNIDERDIDHVMTEFYNKSGDTRDNVFK